MSDMFSIHLFQQVGTHVGISRIEGYAHILQDVDGGIYRMVLNIMLVLLGMKVCTLLISKIMILFLFPKVSIIIQIILTIIRARRYFLEGNTPN